VKQVEVADQVVLTKTDLVDGARVDGLRSAVARYNPTPPLFEAPAESLAFDGLFMGEASDYPDEARAGPGAPPARPGVPVSGPGQRAVPARLSAARCQGKEVHMESMLIRNGRIVTATDDYRADILVEDGRVRMIGRDIPVGGDVGVHDAGGLLVLPGGVDVHTHLDWDFGAARTVDTFGPGTRAAAFGGTTTLGDFAN